MDPPNIVLGSRLSDRVHLAGRCPLDEVFGLRIDVEEVVRLCDLWRCLDMNMDVLLRMAIVNW